MRERPRMSDELYICAGWYDCDFQGAGEGCSAKKPHRKGFCFTYDGAPDCTNIPYKCPFLQFDVVCRLVDDEEISQLVANRLEGKK